MLTEADDRLREALDANRAGSATRHTLIALPSFSVGESLLSHYAERIGSLEHRYLVAATLLGRVPGCQLVFVCSQPPGEEVLDHYLGLLPAAARASARRRLHLVVVPDCSARPVAAKLLDRPDLLGGIRALVGSRPALIEPWNVSGVEAELSHRLDVPINGTPPHLRRLAFKSAGRRLLRSAGVPVPAGVEDVRSAGDIVDASELIRSRRPDAAGVVVKTDDSGAGDGNQVIRFNDGSVADAVGTLPDWYLRDVSQGAVVEEFVTGSGGVSSPSVQVDIEPGGNVTVLATHEQVLGGPGRQVYVGCRFPAHPDYAARLAAHGRMVGHALAERGALGRLSVDFIAAREGSQWRVYGLEVNLRKGGTTHPYCVLRNLAPGRYDPDAGRWQTNDGETRCYEATDNLLSPRLAGQPPNVVLDALTNSGLAFDPTARKGVVLHMLSGLALDGRFGCTAIGETPDEARALADAVHQTVAR